MSRERISLSGIIDHLVMNYFMTFQSQTYLANDARLINLKCNTLRNFSLNKKKLEDFRMSLNQQSNKISFVETEK